MSKKAIWAIVAIIVIIGIIWLVSSRSSKAPIQNDGMSTTTDSTVSSANPVSQSPFTVSGSFADLMGHGGNYTCTFSVKVASASTTGTIYISKDKLRADFSSVVPPSRTTVETHMLKDADWVYSWSSAMAQGFKMHATSTMPKASGSVSTNPSFDYNQNLDYSCVPSAATSTAMFTLPSGVTFVDAASMMK